MANTKEPMDELLARSRRTETRVTQLLVALGVHTDAQRPTFQFGSQGQAATVSVPSPHSALSEILACVPVGHEGPIDLMVNGEKFATIRDCIKPKSTPLRQSDRKGRDQ